MKTAVDIVRILSGRFCSLPSREVDLLASIIQMKKIPKGTILLDEGQIAQYITYVDLL